MLGSELHPTLVDMPSKEIKNLFEEAIREAVQNTLKRGRPITYVRDRKVIKEYPSGKKEVLETISL